MSTLLTKLDRAIKNATEGETPSAKRAQRVEPRGSDPGYFVAGRSWPQPRPDTKFGIIFRGVTIPKEAVEIVRCKDFASSDELAELGDLQNEFDAFHEAMTRNSPSAALLNWQEQKAASARASHPSQIAIEPLAQVQERFREHATSARAHLVRITVQALPLVQPILQRYQDNVYELLSDMIGRRREYLAFWGLPPESHALPEHNCLWSL